MIYEVILSDRARSDLEEAYCWYAERSREQAVRWYNGFLEALTTLSTNPERCALATENRKFSFDVRELLYGKRHNWHALFTLRQNTVVVLHLRHAARREVGPADLD